MGKCSRRIPVFSKAYKGTSGRLPTAFRILGQYREVLMCCLSPAIPNLTWR